MNQYIFFTGASGVGKSTILNYIKSNLDWDVLEVSARPYLPKEGSYDQTLTDETQTLITQHRTLSFLDVVLNSDKNTVLSRSPIDSLAYQRVLGKANYLESVYKREIEIITKSLNCHFIYIPIEFPMEIGDGVRGNNQKVQLETDKAIQDILKEFNIVCNTLSGSPTHRQERVKYILNNIT